MREKGPHVSRTTVRVLENSLVAARGDPMAQLDRPAPLVWRRSTFCEAGNCVEVAFTELVVHVRDSRGSTLAVSCGVWNAFLTEVKDGTFGS
jgi:hypothetical protein